MHETTRPATVDDLADVVALMRLGREDLVDARGGAMWLAREAIPEPLDDSVEAIITAEECLVQLGFIDDVPLGVVVCSIDAVGGVRLATIRELFVVAAARGVGLGELIMDDVLGWAGDQGCVGIDGFALPGDRATKNFFETYGLVARGIVVHRALDGG